MNYRVYKWNVINGKYFFNDLSTVKYLLYKIIVCVCVCFMISNHGQLRTPLLPGENVFDQHFLHITISFHVSSAFLIIVWNKTCIRMYIPIFSITFWTILIRFHDYQSWHTLYCILWKNTLYLNINELVLVAIIWEMCAEINH